MILTLLSVILSFWGFRGRVRQPMHSGGTTVPSSDSFPLFHLKLRQTPAQDRIFGHFLHFLTIRLTPNWQKLFLHNITRFLFQYPLTGPLRQTAIAPKWMEMDNVMWHTSFFLRFFAGSFAAFLFPSFSFISSNLLLSLELFDIASIYSLSRWLVGWLVLAFWVCSKNARITLLKSKRKNLTKISTNKLS